MTELERLKPRAVVVIRGLKGHILHEIVCDDIFDGMTVRFKLPRDLNLRKGYTLEYEIQYEDPDQPEKIEQPSVPKRRASFHKEPAPTKRPLIDVLF